MCIGYRGHLKERVNLITMVEKKYLDEKLTEGYFYIQNLTVYSTALTLTWTGISVTDSCLGWRAVR